MKKRGIIRALAIILSVLLLVGDGSAITALAAGNEAEYGQEFEGEESSAYAISNAKFAHYMGYSGQGVKVALLSTGIADGHAKINYNRVQKMSVNNLGTSDSDGQGTHLASILLGNPGDADGVCGMAPHVDLLSIKVCSGRNYADSAALAEGINVALANHADIICIGVGTYTYNAELEAAILRAYQSGVAVFAAAGDNNTNSISYPAKYKGAIPVAALRDNMTKTNKSNFGSKIRYSAPGNSYGASHSNTNALVMQEGTAQATAFTAGAAAVLWNEADGTGSKKVDNLLKLMDRSCVRASGSGLGKGCVNLAKALGLKDSTQAPAKPVFVNKPGTYDSKTTMLEFEPTELGSVIYYTTDGSNVDLKNYKAGKYNVYQYEGPQEIGNMATCTIKAMAYNRESGLSSSVVSGKYTFKPKAQYLFIATKDTSASAILYPGESLALKMDYQPSYAKPEKITWSITKRPNEENDKDVTISKSGVIKIGKNADLGDYTVTAYGDDFKSDTFDFVVAAKSDNPVTRITAAKSSVKTKAGRKEYVPITILKKDGTEMEVMDLLWTSSDNNVAYVMGSADNELMIRTQNPGRAVITGRAKDGSKKYVKITVTVEQRVGSITIDNMPDVIARGSSYTLKTTVLPSNAPDKKLKWSISSEDGEVTDGSVTVVNGKITVSKDAKPGYYYVCASVLNEPDSVVSTNKRFEVVEAAPAKMQTLTVDTKTLEMYRTPNGDNTAEFNITSDSRKWTVKSSNPNLVQVKNYDYTGGGGNGRVTLSLNPYAPKTGSVVITVSATDGSNKKATIKVNVLNKPTGFVLAPASGRSSYASSGVKWGRPGTLKLVPYMITQEGKVNASFLRNITYTSGNISVATVDKKGVVSIIGENYTSAVITATAPGGFSASYTVYCCGRDIYDLDVNYGNGKNGPDPLKVGEKKSYRITAWAGFGSVASNAAEWLSVSVTGDGLAAYVDQGGNLVVEANKAGSYTVTLTPQEGSKIKRTIRFTVKK